MLRKKKASCLQCLDACLRSRYSKLAGMETRLHGAQSPGRASQLVGDVSRLFLRTVRNVAGLRHLLAYAYILAIIRAVRKHTKMWQGPQVMRGETLRKRISAPTLTGATTKREIQICTLYPRPTRSNRNGEQLSVTRTRGQRRLLAPYSGILVEAAGGRVVTNVLMSHSGGERHP